MSHTSDLQRAERDAIGKYIRDHSAAVWQVKSADEQYIGSAICVEIADRFFIASAAHNFDVVEHGGKAITFSDNRSSDTPLKIVAQNRGASSNPVSDLAWLEVDPTSAAESSLSGIPLRFIESRHTLELNGHYTIVGLPSELSEITDTDNDRTITGTLVFCHTTPIEAASAADDYLLLQYSGSALGDHGVVKSPHPGGISGGGIWYIPAMNLSEVWSPARYRIVGLATQYLPVSRRIVGLRMHHWLKFVSDDHPELRELIAPLL